VSGSGISWAVCKSAPCSRQITMPAPHHSVFYRPDALPAAQPTASKHWRHSQFWLRMCQLIVSVLYEVQSPIQASLLKLDSSLNKTAVDCFVCKWCQYNRCHHHPSPPHSFIQGSKPSFSASLSHCSFLLFLQDWLHRFSGLFTDTPEHIRFSFLVFPIFSCWFRAVD